MSDHDATPFDGDEDDALAAEYALGVLDAAERAQVRARLEVDAGFARRVEGWAARLSGLNDGYQVDPERDGAVVAAAWPGIEAAIMPALAARRAWWQRPAWQWGGVLAAVLVLAVALPVMQPAPAPLVARLQTAEALVFDARLEGAQLIVARVGPAAQAAQDYQLWAIGADGVPRSLGLLRAAEQAVALGDIVLAEGITLAVSLEPRGGSPLQVPTGPVLAAAVLAQS